MPDPLRTDLIVSDVDNTLFDWVAIWSGAFQAMLARLAEDTHVPALEWMAIARQVHARRGVTECPTLLEELAASPTWPDHVDRNVVVPRAVAVYRRYWDVHLAPFAGVRETLTTLAVRGVPVVGYTESDASITAARLTRMGLAGVIRMVFGRAAGHVPVRRDWALVPLAHRSPIAIDLIPQEDSKPNPLGLRTILARWGVDPAHAVYLGDNLRNDVAMAKRLGVRALWAAYGAERRPHDAALLESVAHGSAADLTLERSASIDTVQPDARLAQPTDLLDAVGFAAATAA